MSCSCQECLQSANSRTWTNQSSLRQKIPPWKNIHISFPLSIIAGTYVNHVIPMLMLAGGNAGKLRNAARELR